MIHYYFLFVVSCAGLFKPFEDSTSGYWLDQERTLEYYDIKSGDTLMYKIKNCPLRVRTLDGSVKTLLIDESQTVAELTKAVCARIGIYDFVKSRVTISSVYVLVRS